MSRERDLSAVTVVIPFLEGSNERWLAEAQASLPRDVKVIVARNRGDLSGALNRALKAADTEFVFRLDADDIAMPGFLDHLLGPAWNADVVYPALIPTDETLTPSGEHDAAPFCGYRLLDMNYISGAALIRREKALEVGGYRDLPVMEDWDLWVRMHRAGARFKPCSEALLLYRQHDRSRNDEVRDDPELRERLRQKILHGGGLARFRRSPDPLEDVQATFYNAATPATTYLRCQLPGRYLPAVVRPDLMIAHNDTEIRFPEQRGKAAIFQLASDQSAAFGVVAMRENGYRVLVESDDNYLASPGKQIRARQQWGKTQADGKRHSVKGHKWIVSEAHGVIVTTEHLARQYRQIAREVFVAPNTVDPIDWPEPKKPNDGVLRIVWTASVSHTADIPLVTRAFEWASQQPMVEVYTVGLNPGWKFKHGYLPWLNDLDAYRHSFHHFDIGVAPIKASPFALGRSDVKALEYAMGGCAPILSDVAPYDLWTDGENCLKAHDPKSFLRAIQHLVTNRDEVKQLAAAARAYTLAERTTEKQVHTWREAIDG